MFMSPHYRNSAFGLYKYFKVSSSFFMESIKISCRSSVTLKTVILDASVSSSTAQISKSFSLQVCDISIFFNIQVFANKDTHASTL